MKFIFFFSILHILCNDIKRPGIETLILGTVFYTNTQSERVGFISSDFSSVGKVNLLNPDTQFIVQIFANIHSDSVAKFQNNRLYIINRLNRDSILVLNPFNAYLPQVEFSVGKGTNPYDIEIINSSKAYISLYNSKNLLVVNPESGTFLKQIDLSTYSEQSSNGTTGIDGLPEMAYMSRVDNSVYLTLQRLDRNDPSGIPSPNTDSLLLEFDTITDQIVKTYTIPIRNPISSLQKLNIDGELNLIFACPNKLGFISRLDGGIVAFNTKTKSFRLSPLLTETEAQGDILDIQIKNNTEGYAFVLDSSFNKSIIEFNPNTGKKIKNILNFSSSAGNISGLLLTNSEKLYIGDGTFSRPSLSIFDTSRSDKVRINSSPIETNLRTTQIFKIGE